MLLQQACREARERIGFVEQRGDLHPGGGDQHGAADITPGAQDRIRPEFLQDPLCLTDPFHQLDPGSEIVDYFPGFEAPMQIPRRDRPDGKALPGHQIHLHIVRRAKKEDIAVRHQRFQPLSRGHRRVDMSPGPSAGEQKSHGFPLIYPVCPGRPAGSDPPRPAA